MQQIKMARLAWMEALPYAVHIYGEEHDKAATLRRAISKMNFLENEMTWTTIWSPFG